MSADLRLVALNRGTLRGVFHVELRRFPHVARIFNLEEDEVQARIVLPWIRGVVVQAQDRSWAPDRSRLTIYQGPAVAAEDRGLGRGWSAVSRGEDVTARLLDEARKLVPHASELKRRLLEASPIPLNEAVSLLGPGWRASERLAVAEQAVWELLHEGRLALVRSGESEPVRPEEWEPLLLCWETWTGASPPTLRTR